MCVIYRVEPKNIDPNRPTNNHGHTHQWRRLPTPGNEIEKRTGKYYHLKKKEVCGTKTLKLLKRWFPEFDKIPHDHHVVKLKVEPRASRHLTYQSIFPRNKATILKIVYDPAK